MRKVAVLGIVQTSISEHYDFSRRDLTANAVHYAFRDAGRNCVDGLFIGNMLSGSFISQDKLNASPIGDCSAAELLVHAIDNPRL